MPPSIICAADPIDPLAVDETVETPGQPTRREVDPFRQLRTSGAGLPALLTDGRGLRNPEATCPWESCKEVSSRATSLECAVINPRQAPISTSSSHLRLAHLKRVRRRSAGTGLSDTMAMTIARTSSEYRSDLVAEHRDLDEIVASLDRTGVGQTDARGRMGGARPDKPPRFLRRCPRHSRSRGSLMHFFPSRTPSRTRWSQVRTRCKSTSRAVERWSLTSFSRGGGAPGASLLGPQRSLIRKPVFFGSVRRWERGRSSRPGSWRPGRTART